MFASIPCKQNQLTCKRTNFTLKHGEWRGAQKPPEELHPHKKGYWTACESHLYDPDMAVTYKCNGYSFSVETQQNFCLLEAGDQHNRIYDIDKHLSVTGNEIQHANKKLRRPGVAQVDVSLK